MRKRSAVPTTTKVVCDLRVQIISAQAELNCLAEDALRAGNQSLYEKIRKFAKDFGAKGDELLQQNGAQLQIMLNS